MMSLVLVLENVCQLTASPTGFEAHNNDLHISKVICILVF